MICLGFNYDKSPSKAVKQQQAESIDRNLSIPYEILQVWRIHVLYTKKYEEFCLLVSNSGNKFIPFVPPKQIWKKADPKTLNAYFRFNHDLMAKAFTKNKKDIDSLFVFQSSYLKNTLHFCLCESISPNMVGNVVAAYNNEVNNQNGVFKKSTRDINGIKELSASIENMIFKVCVADEPVNHNVKNWNATNNVYGAAREKVTVFQNLNLPLNFNTNFGIEHLLSLNKANEYVEEYKKFLFMNYVQKGTAFCPSEQVDLVWHYHQNHTKEYKDFSSMYMDTEVYYHNPSDGSESDGNKFKNVYDDTLRFLEAAFGPYNPEIWPKKEIRFSQYYRWFNHHLFLSQTSLWKNEGQKNGKIFTSNKVYNRDIYVGCYVGCGYYVGSRNMMLGCSAFVGCGGFFHACGGKDNNLISLKY